MVGARGEPGREAADTQLEHLGYGLVASQVDEHAERLVGERAQPPVAQGGGDVRRDESSLADGVLGSRRRRTRSFCGRVGDGGRVADRPDVVVALDAQVAVGRDAPAFV